MKKEKIIKTHTRKTKSGKTVTVRQHRAKYDAAEEAKQLAKKIGAGDELESLKKKGKYEVLGVDLSKMSDEDFKEFAFGFMDENDKQAPTTRGAFKKWVEKQNWGSEGDANFREGVAEYMKNGGAKGIVSSGKDPITEATRKKGKAHLDNIQKSSDQRNSIERPPKTATKPTGVKSPGKTSTPVHGVSAEEFKAWYHWDAAGDPKNKTALAVEKKLRAKMGRSEYNKYFDEVTNSYSSRGHLKAYKTLEPETAKAIKSNKMVAGTAEAQKEVAKLQGAKKAEKIFAAKEKEAKGNLNKLSGKGTDKVASDKVISNIVKNYKGASDTVLNRMTKEALAVDGKEDTFSKDWSRTKKLAVLKKGLSTSDLTPEDFTALHKKSLRYAKETPKSKPTGMYTRDEFLKEMKSGKIPSLAHRAEPKQVAQTAPTKDEIAKYKQDWGEDETYRQMKAEYADSKRKKPKSRVTIQKISPKVVGWEKKNGTEVAKYNTEEKSPDNVSKQVKFKAKEGYNYKMSDGSILTYIGRNVAKGRKGAHRFKDFKTGKIKFKDSDTIYALSEQVKRFRWKKSKEERKRDLERQTKL